MIEPGKIFSIKILSTIGGIGIGYYFYNEIDYQKIISNMKEETAGMNSELTSTFAETTIEEFKAQNMIMKNFPDYLLDVSPDSNQFVVRHPIDTLVIGLDTITSDIGRVVQDSLTLSSSQFKNLESIEWDLDAEPSLQRYRLRNSGWVQQDTMIYYADTFDVKAYWAVLDTPLIDNGFMFVDTSEWQDTSYAFIKDDLMTFTNISKNIY